MTNTTTASISIPMTINRTKTFMNGIGRKNVQTITVTLKKDTPAKIGKAGNSKFRSAYMTWVCGGFEHTNNTGVLEISKGSLRRYGIQLLKDEGDFIAFQIPGNHKLNQARIKGLLDLKFNTNGKATKENLAKGMTHLAHRPDRISLRYINEILSLYGAEIVSYSPAGRCNSGIPSEAYLVKPDGSQVPLEFDKTYRIPANGAKVPNNIINL